ncbi:hypothetical protein, partial [Micromonospora andamanensis]|uniref:hypothetical protein n=1 Tax=Micromonospora andamanensis TaxID=1287068 RepID=UPI00194DFD51
SLTFGGWLVTPADHGDSPWSIIFLSREEDQYQGLSWWSVCMMLVLLVRSGIWRRSGGSSMPV